MTTIRNMVAFIAIGSVALGCAAEMSPEQSAPPDMANEGDRAIQRYERARQLDPANHHILFMLAQAYERNHDWATMASTMSRAVQMAPHVALYWQRRGFALLMQAHAGEDQPGALARAEEALKKCIENDPQMIECFLLMTFTNLPRPACPACGGAL